MAWLILLVACLPMLPILWMIDDWSRDWTQNHAATSPQHKDPTLRPKASTLPPDQLAERLSQWAGAQPHWETVSRESQQDGIALTLVHSTRLWGFKDDVRVAITAESDGSLVSASSQSRIGKGDLGQNPRNLRELLQAVPEQ